MKQRSATCALGALFLLASCTFDTGGLSHTSRADTGIFDATAGDGAPSVDAALDACSDLALVDGAQPDQARDLASPDSPQKADLLRPDLPPQKNLVIYGDALAADWSDWSWSATIDLGATSRVKVGSRAAAVTYQAWGGFSLRKDPALGTAGYSALRFWVHGGSGSSKSLMVYTRTADTSGSSPGVGVTALASTWVEAIVPLKSLGNPATIKRLDFQNQSGSSQPTMIFDHIRLVP